MGGLIEMGVFREMGGITGCLLKDECGLAYMALF
jgi:hypothetical protein